MYIWLTREGGRTKLSKEWKDSRPYLDRWGLVQDLCLSSEKVSSGCHHAPNHGILPLVYDDGGDWSSGNDSPYLDVFVDQHNVQSDWIKDLSILSY